MSGRNLLLDAESLMSKWGFDDGSALDDWWGDVYDTAPRFNTDDVLHALVVAHLVPALRAAGHEVELIRIETSHNPVRADTLDGQLVDHYSNARRLEPPVWVALSPEQVADTVRKVILGPASQDALEATP